MKAELIKRILLGVAAVVLVIIWSRNLLLFFPQAEKTTRIDSPAARATLSDKPGEKEDGESEFVFADGVRNPFQIPEPKATSADGVKRKGPPPPPPEPPHASLIGIVWSAKSPQVVVFDSLTKGSVILSERQTINDYQIRSISKTQVVLQSKRQRVVWKANE